MILLTGQNVYEVPQSFADTEKLLSNYNRTLDIYNVRFVSSFKFKSWKQFRIKGSLAKAVELITNSGVEINISNLLAHRNSVI